MKRYIFPALSLLFIAVLSITLVQYHAKPFAHTEAPKQNIEQPVSGDDAQIPVTQAETLGNIGEENKETTIEEKPSDTPQLSNKLIAWGLGVKTGEPPTVPSETVSLLSKYDSYYIGDIRNKEVYLTFDEGYEEGYTETILDILKDNGVKAAFFITGHYLKTQPELVKRMVAEGHTLGNHTQSHPSMPSLSNDDLREELDKLNNDYNNLTGGTMVFLRPPMGEFSQRTLALSREQGYKTILWSLAFKDWIPLPGGPEESYNTVMERLHNGAIILLHAKSRDNVMALDRIIKDVKDKGYSFKTLDQLPPYK